MTHRARALGAALALVVALVAAVSWWLVARSMPERVGPRFVAALQDGHPGTTVLVLDRGALRATMPSGVTVEADLPRLFDACRSSRLYCTAAFDDALADIDRSVASAGAPQVARLRPLIVPEPGGYRYGYLTDPLVGPLEIRYALVDGIASTYVTGTIVDRLGLSPAALRDAALAGLRRDPPATVDRIDAKGATLFRVRSDGDPVASLLDRDRMTRFATEIGARKLFGVVPLRGSLLLAAASDVSARALAAESARERGASSKTLDSGIVAYDLDAGDGPALTVATLSTALPPP